MVYLITLLCSCFILLGIFLLPYSFSQSLCSCKDNRICYISVFHCTSKLCDWHWYAKLQCRCFKHLDLWFDNQRCQDGKQVEFLREDSTCITNLSVGKDVHYKV